MGAQFAGLLLVLGSLPFLLVVLHGLLARLLKLVGIDPGPQLMAIVLLLLLNAAIVALFVTRGILVEAEWYEAGYIVLTANAMWFVYFQVFVNLSLTSLHARLLLVALWNGAAEPRSLAREYDSQAMLSARLHRLQGMRQITVEGDVVSLQWPYLLWLSYPLYWWRRLIRMEGERLNLANARNS